MQKDFAGGGSAAVTGSALRDPALAAKYRWLPAIADAVDASIPKPRTPDEPKMEDLLGTALNQALVEAISKKSGYTQIAQSHLNTAASRSRTTWPSRAPIDRGGTHGSPAGPLLRGGGTWWCVGEDAVSPTPRNPVGPGPIGWPGCRRSGAAWLRLQH